MENKKPTRSQIEMLQLLASRGNPVEEQELDGRVAKALLARGWARHVRKGVEITEAGCQVLLAGRPEHSSRRRRKSSARSQAVLQTIDRLEGLIPRDSELAVGPIFAHVDDVLDGFREIARRMEKQS